MLLTLKRYGLDRPLLTWFLALLGIGLMIWKFLTFWWLGILLILWSGLLVYQTSRKNQLVDYVLRHFDLSTMRKILDVDTDHGFFLVKVAKYAGRIGYVTGIEDQRHNHTKKARKNVKFAHVQNRVNIIHGDLRHLPFARASFDMITALGNHRGVFEHLNSKQYQPVLADIQRVLKPNGVLLIVSNQFAINQLAQALTDTKAFNVTSTHSNHWDAVRWGSLKAVKK